MLPVASKPCAKIWILNACGAESCLNESVAMSVMGLVPTAVGVPERTPPAENVRPAGRVPTLILQVNGGATLDAMKLKLKGSFSPPLGGAAVSMTGGAGSLMTMV